MLHLPAQPRTRRHASSLFFFMLMSLWISGCAALPANVHRPVTVALEKTQDTRLGKALVARAAAANTRNESGFALLSSADLAFTSRMALIQAADKTLDLQYYAVHADETTNKLFEALREAARRGVRVRILLDDFNTAGDNAQIMKIGFEKNVELRLFNPLPSSRSSALWRIVSSLGDIDRLQRRMHNKIFVADNTIGITGGRNLGDTYFGRSDGVNFVDLDVLAAGRIVRDLSRSFDQYWNNPLAYPVQALMTAADIDALKARPNRNAASAESALPPSIEPVQANANAGIKTTRISVDPTGLTTTLALLPDTTNLRLLTLTWAPSVMLVDKPSKIAADADAVDAANDTAVDGLLSLMSQAKTDLLVVSPYFVPGPEMMKQFADIRRRGVRVRVLTNSLASNDAVAAHAGYARYRKALIAMGVEMYEMRTEQRGTVASFGAGSGSTGGSAGVSRASLHAKAVVVDNQLLVVGSMNLDLRSKLQNSEVAIAIRNRKLASQATALIEPGMTTGAYRVELEGGQLVWRAPRGLGIKDATSEPDASLGLKLLVELISPFAPDEML